MARTQGQAFEKTSWEPARGRLPVCVQSAGLQSQPLLPCGRDRFTFTTIPNTMPAFLMICGFTIVFFNLPFGPSFGEALSFHYLTALATRHKMAAGAERWKAESGSHFLTELDSDKRTTHDSRQTGQRTFKGEIFC